MVINIKDEQVLTLVTMLKTEQMSLKRYFIEYPNETEGMITPEEAKDVFNTIIEQVIEQGFLTGFNIAK
ncbi:hypothetical protein [Clostridium polynesiense]|uniref:hypothetical protein n=1 Tax=Clostridium polynesiense TaxID=1325933 RepID=UPI00058D8D2E|nr:hypothetical protein [Clostridium polynesiense]